MTRAFPAPLTPAASEVGAEIRRAIADAATVQLRGAGTWWPEIPLGVRPLGLSHLNRISGLQPADLVVTAGAGCPLDALAATLAEHGVWLALDPPGSPSRTVGGALSSGTPGPLAARYGSPRDQVLGLTVVAGNGAGVRMGGRVVKNVAGFDLAKVVVGGQGAFGAIVEAHLRLHALPAADRSLAWTGALRDVAAAATRALSVGAAPAALEVLSPPLTHALLGADGWALAVREMGGRAAVDEDLLAVEKAIGATLRRLAPDAGAAHWHRWRGMVGGWPVLLRVGADPAAWSDAVALAEQHCGSAAGVSVTVIRGTVRVGLATVEPGAVRALRTSAARRGWPVVLDRADAGVRAAAGVWGALQPGTQRLTEQLRRAFDPNGVFAVPLLG